MNRQGKQKRRGRAGGVVLAVLAALVSAAAPLAGARADGVHLAIEPSSSYATPGDTLIIVMRVFVADEEFNAFDLELLFDPQFLTFLPTVPLSAQRGELMVDACPNTFHVFNAAAAQLSATLSLLCANTFVTGPGVIYRVRFIVQNQPGSTTMSCGPGTQFYRAGFAATPLECVGAQIFVSPTGVDGADDVEEAADRPRLTAIPNPATAQRAAFRIDLPQEDTVWLELYDASGRVVARRQPEAMRGGTHRLEWMPPNVGPGHYVVRLTTASGRAARARWTIVR